MNFKAAYRVASILTKSQLRGYQQRRATPRIFGDPRIILPIDVAIVFALALVGYVMTTRFLPDEIQLVLRELETSAVVSIPSAIAFALILFGVLSEVSQPVQSMSTDLVNWLPISPVEYVFGSALSLSYSYSFILSLLLGISLGPAFRFGLLEIWLVSTAMSVISLFIGSSVVELLRAVTNRISSSFYRKSGRSGIFLRLILTVAVLAFFQLLFSGRIIEYVLQGLVQTIAVAWFIPVIWPSLVVLSASQGHLQLSLVFGTLSFGFLLVLFGLAVKLRAKYWVPVPVSIKLTSEAYRPLLGKSRALGLSVAEAAIFLKDMRSLTRRREMARFLAIPFVLVISIVVSLFQVSGTSAPFRNGFLALIPLYLFPTVIFSGMISMTCFGQEGYAVWNLYIAPLSSRQLLKAKLLFAACLGTPFSVLMLVVVGFLLKIDIAQFLFLLALGVVVVLQESALGLYFGAKFPDFRESIRSRYVSVWGSLIGVLAALVAAILTASPIFVSILLSRTPTEGFILSLAVGGIIFLTAAKLAERQVRLLLQNIRV